MKPEPPSRLNFWTPTPWNVRSLNSGDKLYFLIKAPYRKLGGYGHFSYYENMTINEAWSKFGKANGVADIKQFHAVKKGLSLTPSDESQDAPIGCIILDDSVFWDEDQYVRPEDYGLSFPRQIVRLKYFEDYASIKIKLHRRARIALDELPPGERSGILKAIDFLDDVSSGKQAESDSRIKRLTADESLFLFNAPGDLAVIFKFVGKDMKEMLDVVRRERLGNL